MLLERIKALKNLSHKKFASHLQGLSQYGLRSSTDFDRYHAYLNLAEDAAREAHRVRDDKATFLDAAVQTSRSRVSRLARKILSLLQPPSFVIKSKPRSSRVLRV